MKPRVQCVVGLARGTAGMPDVDLFTQEQFQKRGEAEPLPGQKPSRGVVEAKPPKHDIDKLAESAQVLGYWKAHHLVLVTNYRRFRLLVTRDGVMRELESYSLADSEAAFWRLAEHPQKAANEQGGRFVEFMQRVLLHSGAARRPEGRGLVPRLLRSRRARVHRARRPARAHGRAWLAGRSARAQIRGRQGRALLPLYSRADALLRPLRRLGAVAQAAGTPSPSRGEGWGEGERLRVRNLWGKAKYEQLLTDSTKDAAALERDYASLVPMAALGFPFAASAVGEAYLSWPTLPALFPVSFPGVKTSRDDALVDIDRAALLKRMRAYFDGSVSDEEVRSIAPALMENTSGFDPVKTRNELVKRGIIEENIVRYCYRPFDLRWL